jgi:hypothetical protein
MFYGILLILVVTCLGTFISTKLEGNKLYLCGMIVGGLIGIISNIIT